MDPFGKSISVEIGGPSSNLALWLAGTHVLTFVVGEDGGPAGGDEESEGAGDEDEVGLGGLRLTRLEHLAQLVDDDGGEVVEPLADRVEHDEAERDADGGVRHREELAKVRLGRRVAVT